MCCPLGFLVCWYSLLWSWHVLSLTLPPHTHTHSCQSPLHTPLAALWPAVLQRWPNIPQPHWEHNTAVWRRPTQYSHRAAETRAGGGWSDDSTTTKHRHLKPRSKNVYVISNTFMLLTPMCIDTILWVFCLTQYSTQSLFAPVALAPLPPSTQIVISHQCDTVIPHGEGPDSSITTPPLAKSKQTLALSKCGLIAFNINRPCKSPSWKPVQKSGTPLGPPLASSVKEINITPGAFCHTTEQWCHIWTTHVT